MPPVLQGVIVKGKRHARRTGNTVSTRVASNTARKKARCEQLFLDVGQRDFEAVQCCRHCRMVYSGVEEDRRVHSSFCGGPSTPAREEAIAYRWAAEKGYRAKVVEGRTEKALYILERLSEEDSWALFHEPSYTDHIAALLLGRECASAGAFTSGKRSHHGNARENVLAAAVGIARRRAQEPCSCGTGATGKCEHHTEVDVVLLRVQRPNALGRVDVASVEAKRQRPLGFFPSWKQSLRCGTGTTREPSSADLLRTVLEGVCAHAIYGCAVDAITQCCYHRSALETIDQKVQEELFGGPAEALYTIAATEVV